MSASAGEGIQSLSLQAKPLGLPSVYANGIGDAAPEEEEALRAALPAEQVRFRISADGPGFYWFNLFRIIPVI